ncbi:MAG: malate/lactate/ureidoglycolate dehydrogenase [Burkholderiaceae bacterium]|nr:malate/lactate/ureidoglycolate dehydrogenase [Burkholderiaceae bacterium]MDZ4143654.1 malate/lactate/ureidoglycolate dehydrogenase [Burkholderiales bacterium]
MSKLLQAPALRSYIATILEASGSATAEAATVAANLVLANLSGHDSHGVGMVPRYVDAVREGGLKPNTAARVTLDSGTLLALDGQRGYGQVVGEQAMQLGIERARAHGSCIMTLGQAHHLGRIGHFAEMAVAQGLVSLHFVNVLSRPVVAAWGGADGRFGTNPCCIGVPLKDREPFILDFATSRVAQGKMRVAHNEGRRVAPGYLIDAQGHPTTDPGVVVVPQGGEGQGGSEGQGDGRGEKGAGGGANPPPGLFGALLTFGEHKGYGMAVACELLGGALSGGGTWHRPADTARAVLNGMLTILIDPARLGTQATFEQEAAAFVDWLKAGPVAPDHDAVRLAGEPEREARARRHRAGIAIDDTTWAEIQAAAHQVGAPQIQGF